jgi:sulfate permease, SulP family
VRRIKGLARLPHDRRSSLGGDLVAGVTVAALIVPQSMAYVKLAGLPPVVGLYASAVPALAYAAVGRSPQMSIGPLTSISLITAVTLEQLADPGTARYIGLAATMALVVGAVYLALGLGRLGFVVRFVSEPVLWGFLSAVAVLLVVTQLGPLFGFTVPSRERTYEDLWEWLQRLDETSVATLALGAAAVAAMYVGRRWRRFPSILAVVAVASMAAWIFDLADHGIALVGSVPSGLAGPDVPPLGLDELGHMVPAALAIVLIGFLESITVARDYADRDGYEVEPNRELVAYGLTNAIAGFFQGLPVTSAISRSAVADESGVRTNLGGVIAAAVVVVSLLALSGAFQYIPDAVLAAVVIMAVIGLVKIGEARQLWTVKRSDFWMMAVSFTATLTLGLEVGVLLGAALSLVLVVWRAAHPPVTRLGRQPGTDFFVPLGRAGKVEVEPGVLIVRVDGPIVFVNAEPIERHLRRLVAEAGPVRVVVLDLSGVDDLDATGDHRLRKLVAAWRHDVEMLVVNVNEDVYRVMQRSGLAGEIGRDRFFASDADAIDFLERR